jgi:hypothetical protein
MTMVNGSSLAFDEAFCARATGESSAPKITVIGKDGLLENLMNTANIGSSEQAHRFVVLFLNAVLLKEPDRSCAE